MRNWLIRLHPQALGLTVFVAVFGGTSLTLGYMYAQMRSDRMADVTHQLNELAATAATLVDAAQHEEVDHPDDIATPQHRRLLEPLVQLHLRNPEVLNISTARLTPDGSHLRVLQTHSDHRILDLHRRLGRDPQALPRVSAFSTVLPEPAADAALNAGAQTFVLPREFHESFGHHVESRAALRDSTGRLVGYVSVEYDLNQFTARLGQIQNLTATAIVVSFLVAALIGLSAMQMRRDILASVSQIQASEAAMRAERDRADRASQAKSELLAVATHDLKNPLGAISGMSDLLLATNKEKAAADPLETEMLESIRHSASHMFAIVKGVLDHEAMEHSGLAGASDTVSLSDTIRKVVDFNKAYAAKKQIVMDIDIADGVDVMGDATRLKEAADNYVSNAIKYSPAGSRIRVALGTGPAGVARFEVRDSGPGLTEADKQKLFGKFQKLSARPTAGETSTGLGLSIVKSIVELHHGRVGCDSEHGKGSVFWAELPTAKA